MSPTPLPAQLGDDRVTLRRWVPHDAAVLHRLVRDNLAHLEPWMPWIAFEPFSLPARRTLIEGWERAWAAGGDVLYAIEVDGEAVGSCGLHRRLGPEGLELGYWVAEAHQGRGVATAVVEVLTAGALALEGIEAAQIVCDEANAASRRVAEKAGYVVASTGVRTPTAPGECGTFVVYRTRRGGGGGPARQRVP